MRMMKWFKGVSVLAMMLMLVLSSSVTAFAYVDESQAASDVVIEEEFKGEEIPPETEAPAESEPETQPTEEQPAEDTNEDAFSVDGNGTVLDNLTDGKSGKEFYTIQTANNNTYFLVIDHASTSQNVYMLSMIDENDLKEFLTEEADSESQQTPPAVVIPEETEKEEVEKEPVEPEQPAKSSNMGTLLILLVIGGVIAGGYYYIKIYKPKHDGSFSDDEDLEYMDEGEPVNEDSAEYADTDKSSGTSDEDDGYYLDDDEE